MPSHIVKDTVSRYGNDVQIDAGDGDELSLVRRGGQDTDIHNYNYTVIAQKLAELQSTWQTLTVGASIAYDVANGVNAKLATPGAGNTIAALTNAVDGMTGSLLIQGGANSPSWHASWDFGDAGAPTLTNDNAKMDLVSWVRKGSKTIAVCVQGFANA